MQKVIFLTESQREELEDFLEECSRDIYCSFVANHLGLDASDVEKVYEDLFENDERTWDCAEHYDEDDIKYNEAGDFYYVGD